MTSSRVVTPQAKNTKHNHGSADKRLVEAFGLIIEYLTRDGQISISDANNYADTAVRAAKALQDLTGTKTDILQGIEEIMSTGFPMDISETYKPGIICQGPIKAYSMCPHHLLLVELDIYMGYLPKPGGVVLGLSKLTRIAQLLAKRPVLQEQLASDIADVFCINQAASPWVKGIETDGSAVLVIGRHSCMSCRGVESDAVTSTSEVRGSFFNPEMEMKFLTMVREMRESRLVK